MECLNNIIGLSRTECECVASAIPAEDQVSKSGIYVDEVEGGLKISAIDKIDCQDFADKARQARKRAIDMFVEQIISIYSTSPYKRRFPRSFNSRIADVKSLRALNVSQYSGLRLRTNFIRGAYITIANVGLIINQESDVDVYIYKGYRNTKDDDLELIGTIADIPTLANIPSIKAVEPHIKLPLFDDELKPIDYYFVYDTSHGQPRDNKASCGCGGAEVTLKTFLTPEGVSAADIDGLQKSNSSSYANGVFIDAKVDCTMRDIVCELLSVDESNTVAHSIAYKAQELLIEDLMGSGDINRYVLLSKEHLWGKRNHFRKEFDDRIVWLSETYPADQLSDCLTCDGDNVIRKILIGGHR